VADGANKGGQASVTVTTSNGSVTPPPPPPPGPAPVTYTLTVQKAGTGSGTVTASGVSCGTDCSQTYASGTSVTLSVTPASGSTFAGWSGGCSGTGTCTVSMTAARSVTATFNTSTGGTPAPGAVAVSFPSLTTGQTVPGGSVQVTIRAAGTGNKAGLTQNRFTIFVDNVQRDFWIVPGTEIRWWWSTGTLAAGSHTLRVQVTDINGKTGTGSITVRK
jgi:hypothetical protein